MPSASLLLFAVTWGGLTPEQAVERALDAAEPPPAMRAAFHATLTSEKATRRVEYDPYADGADKFRITLRSGDDEELDAVVQGWKEERCPDCRLFADDLRLSLDQARITGNGDTMAISFKHRVSANDGPLDAEFSSRMVGRMMLSPKNGYLQQIEYDIERPVKLEDGTTVEEYNQTYHFGFSERWGVSYVMAYELVASGGQWGMNQTRSLNVTLTDIAFGMAGSAEQDLASKASPYLGGLTAKLQ
jgi:hypothetical protein